MKNVTLLTYVLLTACTVPGVNFSSTLSTPNGSHPDAAADDKQTPSSGPSGDDDTPLPPYHPPLDVQLIVDFGEVARTIAEIDRHELGPGHGTTADTLERKVKTCSEDARGALANGTLPTEVASLQDGKLKIKLADIDAQLCQRLAKRIEGWAERENAAREADYEAFRAPYRKAGVGGDKLALVEEYLSRLRAPGQADPTPDNVARANALFVLYQPPGREWTLTRYAFRGNQKVGETEQGFVVRPGPAAYH
jgi:hypothetical protein